MSSDRTYYQVFGVSPRATAPQIRDAYLRLLKEHHPDLAELKGAASRPDIVPLLNRCYAVLRDPQKRAAYDAQLARAQAAGTAAAAANKSMRSDSRLPVVPQKRRWTVRNGLAAAGALILVLLAAQVVIAFPDPPFAAALNRVWPHKAPAEALVEPTAPADALVHRAARLATNLSPEAAVDRSQRCFDEAENAQSLQTAQLCVIFDEAFLYWRKDPDNVPGLPVYFNEEVSRIRYAQALAGFGSNEDAEIQVLRDTAFRALLAEVRASSAAEQAQYEAPAITAAQPQDPAAAAELSRNGT